MDTTLRQMLVKAEQEDEADLLQEVCEKLKCGRKITTEQTDPFSSDLYVIAAEVALKLEKPELVDTCIRLYFQKKTPHNQFLCRAYLCQAQLNAPCSVKDQDKLELCVGFLMKAISFAKTNKRYHFFIYNASVLYWSSVRPFLQPNYRHLLAKSLHGIIKALDEINDKDYEWRAHLMIASLECHIDAGRREDAVHVGQLSFQFTKSFVPHMCKEVFSLQVQYKIIDPMKVTALMKTSTEMAIYYKLLKVKGQPKAPNIQSDLDRIFNMIQNGDDASTTTSRSSSRASAPLVPSEKISLMMDLLRVSTELDQPDVAAKCMKEFKDMNIDSRLSLEIDIIQCDLMVKNLKHKQESYNKKSIEVRMKAIMSLEEHLMAAFRLQDESLIQVGCVTLWNLSLPLLQTNLRHKIRKQLILAVEMLEELDSLLIMLRCQMHMEVAKCEAESDQLQSAIIHTMKALELDDGGQYKVRLENSLKRLKLRALLYQVPEKPEDHAAMIIEQAESSIDASTSMKMRNYLSKAGSLLSPDAFHLAMDGEEVFLNEKSCNLPVEKLADRVKQFKKGMSKIEGHLERLENVDSQERTRLWADLAKTARKQKVWDVTRIACVFCLLYDDHTWSYKTTFSDSPTRSESKHSSNISQVAANHVEFGVLSKEQLQGSKVFSENSDLLRVLAEVNFIYAEALVELLQSQGIQLLSDPQTPVDNKLKPKKYGNNTMKLSETKEWITYKDWINEKSNEAVKHFQRAASLGQELNESWIVYNAAIYVWNYTTHLLSQGKYSPLVPYYQSLFDTLRTVGHGNESIFLSDFTYALAQGYIQPYLPPSFYQPLATSFGRKTESIHKGRKSGLSHNSNQNVNPKGKGTVSVLSVDALSDLKQTLDILEYTLGVTNGTDKSNIVPIPIRNKLLRTWVLCKGLLNQPLPKNYGPDHDLSDSQNPMSKALCALEALSLQTKHIAEFSSCPTVQEVIRLVSTTDWTDKLLLLQIWTHLSVITYNSMDIGTAIECCENALNIGTGPDTYSLKTSKKKSSDYEHNCMVEHEMLFYASMTKGQCLVTKINGQMDVRRKALECFVDATRHGCMSKNYGLVMMAARHYWNTVHDLISVPIERQLLADPIKIILKNIALVAKSVFQEKNEEDNTMSRDSCSAGSVSQKANGMYLSADEQKSNIDEDLTLTASLYGVLFHSYADMGALEKSLTAMNEAVTLMPRTHHRLLIFKHRAITQAKLNRPVQFDMGKFRNENEALISEMWLRVAKYSTDVNAQMSAYINAIEVLTEEENVYQKVECLAEFGEWLFVNEYPARKAIDQIAFAVCVLINGMGSYDYRLEFSTSFTSFSDDIKVFQRIKDVRQMDVLMRLYVMMADIIDHGDDMYRQFNLAAAFLVQHMWKTSILNAEKAIKDGIKPGEGLITAGKNDRKSAKDTVRNEKSPSKAVLPLTLESWATYQLSEKLKDYFKADTHDHYISLCSIQKPLLSLHYLDKLTDNLHSIGFNHLSIYVMLVMNYIADELIGNRSLSLLMFLKCCELYQSLNMNAAHDHFQKLISEPILTTEDQEKSREEIEFWKEKQRQVKLEEKRIASDIQLVTSYDQLSKCHKSKPQIGKLVLREIWARMAEYLIRGGRFQSARMLLEEASLSAHAFEDVQTQDVVKYNLALISYHEADWGKVILLLEDTCLIPSAQMFWLKKVVLMVDSLHSFSQQDSSFQSHISDVGFVRSKEVLENGIATISNLVKARRNCTHLGTYIVARLLGRLGLIVYTESKEKRYKSTSEHTALLKNAYKHLEESFKRLSELGCKSESIETMFLLVEIQKTLALAETDKLAKKKLLLETLIIAQTAVKNVTLAAAEITKISPMEETNSMFLPIQHDVITARVHCIDVMHEIIHLALEERRFARRQEEKKEFIVRFIDDYVEAEQELTTLERTWKNIVSTIPEEALVLSSSIRMICNKMPVLQAQALLHLGKLLCVIAKYNCSGHFDSWEMLESIEECTDKEPHQFVSTETQLTELGNYKQFVSQAAEILLQTIQICLHHQFLQMLEQATSFLLDCVGKRDTHLSAQLLALNQSSGMALICEKLLRRSLLDPHMSECAALLAQRNLLKKDVFNNTPLQVNNAALNSYECYKRISLTKNHFDIVKEIPFHITYVILQHSADKSYVYGGILEKTHFGTAGKKKESGISRSVIARQSTTPELLGKLLELCMEYKQMISGELMRQVNLKHLSKRRKELFGHELEQDETVLKASITSDAESVKISETFSTLVTAMEAYLGIVLVEIEKSLEQEPQPEIVMILADNDLLELPLEALKAFHNESIKSIARDFSLQMFYHRLQQGGDADVGRQSKMEKTNKGKSDGKNGKNSGMKGKQPDKKGAAVKELVFDKDNVIVDLSGLKYLIDPYNDGANDEKQPVHIINCILATHKQKVSKWSGIKGADGTSSVKEMQSLLQSSQGFMFFGFERSLAYIPPRFLASYNLTDSHFAMLFDLVQTSESNIRQGNLDALKSPNDLQLESPTQTAILMSLCGLRTLSLNQWNTTLQNNERRLNTILNGLFENGTNMGRVIRSFIFPMINNERENNTRNERGSAKTKNNEKSGTDRIVQHTENGANKPVSEETSTMGKGSALIQTIYERFNHVLYGIPNVAAN